MEIQKNTFKESQKTACCLNLPIDFSQRIKNQLPSDSEAFIQALSQPPATSIRINDRKSGNVDFDLTDKVPWCENAYFLSERPNFTLDPLFHAGRYYPQEASSMFLWHILKKMPEMPDNPLVLDMCAAPGGKTTLLSQFFKDDGLIIANEYVRSRAWILRENVIKWGHANSMVTNLDTKKFADLGEIFDLILVDAPCSGEGMFRKNPEAINEWSLDNCNKCVVRQREILQNAYNCLACEGYLIYSTCTFNPAENEENMRWLKENFAVEVLEIDHNFKEITNLDPGYAFYPHLTRGEGFYVCVIKKISDKRKNINPKKITDAKINLNDYLTNSNDFLLVIEGENIYALPRKNAQIMLDLKKKLNPISCGIEIGRKTKKEIIFSDELPLYQAFTNDYFLKINLDIDSALKYLRGEWNNEIHPQEGWNVVTYSGANLGFIKAFSNRVNNYYPKNWRIRMQIS